MDQEHQQIRDIRLMRNEKVWTVVHSDLGLLEETPDRGDCIVLTNHRLLGFWQEQGRHRRILLPLESVNGVELSSTERSLKPLMQGALLLLAAAVVVWLALAFNALGVLSWLIVTTMVLLAGVTASAFLASEQTAVITFRAGTSEVTLPLRTPQAQEAAQTLALRFFQARAGVEGDSLGHHQQKGYQEYAGDPQNGAGSDVPPVVAPVAWPDTPEPGPFEAVERGDAGSVATPLPSMESTQAEGRRDI